jgi:hypothetical protein
MCRRIKTLRESAGLGGTGSGFRMTPRSLQGDFASAPARASGEPTDHRPDEWAGGYGISDIGPRNTEEGTADPKAWPGGYGMKPRQSIAGTSPGQAHSSPNLYQFPRRRVPPATEISPRQHQARRPGTPARPGAPPASVRTSVPDPDVESLVQEDRTISGGGSESGKVNVGNYLCGWTVRSNS